MSGAVVWFTGPPSSGKSTLAERAAVVLRAEGRPVVVLDGDRVRAAMVPPPGYDPAARDAFYETLARLAVLLAGQGLLVLVPATAHRRAFRARARALSPRFIEVFVTTSQEECAARDAKGLYSASQRGEVSDVPGAGADYEPPEAPEIRALGREDEEGIKRIAGELCALIGP